MASPGILGMWGGIGQGLAMVGQQGMKDQSEQARIKLSHALDLERDELQAGRASAEAEKDRGWRTGEAEAARKAAADEAEKARKAEADLRSKGWDREDARAGRSDAARVKAAEIKAAAKDKAADQVQSVTKLEDGTVLITYKSGSTQLADPSSLHKMNIAEPGESPEYVTDSILSEVDAEVQAKLDDMNSLFGTEAGNYKAYGGKRENAEKALKAEALAQRGYSPELVQRHSGINILGGSTPKPSGYDRLLKDAQAAGVISKDGPTKEQEAALRSQLAVSQAPAPEPKASAPALDKPAGTGQAAASNSLSDSAKARREADIKQKLADLKQREHLAGTEYKRAAGRGTYKTETYPTIDAELQAIASKTGLPLETIRSWYGQTGK